MAKDLLPIALTQMSCTPDIAANTRRQLELTEQAAREGAKIICTQEMFRTQYFCQCEDHAFFQTAETIPGPSTEAFARIAKQYGCVIIASLFERRAQGLYHNTAAVLNTDGSLMGIYRKMHIPDDPLFYEKFYFTPGDTGFKTFDTPFARIGVLICWDQWYPEAARATALRGAQILFYPTAIGWHPSEKAQYGKPQHEAWELVQRSHGVANGCFIAAANRHGHELVASPAAGGRNASDDGLEFWGQSFVSGPDGQILAKAPVAQDAILHSSLDLERVEFSRTHWPFLRDRRIDAYADLTRRFID
jgi:N-carbamoylputrescine amidase